MARFKLRRSRLRGSDSDRLRGGLGISTPTVSAGTAIAGLSPETRKTTWMNPNAHPRTVLEVAGVTAAPAVGILHVGVTVRAPGVAPQPRVVVPVVKAPQTVGGVTSKTPSAVIAAPQSPDVVQGVSPDVGGEVSVAPTVPEEPVVRPAAPSPSVVGRTKR